MREVRRFGPPYDRDAVDATVRDAGVAVLVGLLPPELCERACREIDGWLAGQPDDVPGISRAAHSLAVHALDGKIACAAELIRPELRAWAGRLLAPRADGIVLAALDYRERRPGERPDQPAGLHRGTDAWPDLPADPHPVSGYAILALGEFTVANGAPWFALGSHRLSHGEPPDRRILVRATANPGDAVVYRSDVLHGIGANATADRPLRSVSIGYQVDWLPKS